MQRRESASLIQLENVKLIKSEYFTFLEEQAVLFRMFDHHCASLLALLLFKIGPDPLNNMRAVSGDTEDNRETSCWPPNTYGYFTMFIYKYKVK